ncbi:MAG: hypothetical protein KA535_08175 [Azonexus sp.]|nr:hypothetical protein [Azonexus sp.]
MLWTVAIEFTKYALLTWFILGFAFVGWLYFRTNDIKYALSVLAREESGHYKGLPEWQALTLKAIHFARLSTAIGTGALLLLQVVQLALASSIN